MNNNNIYFSCFSLIRACVSCLFANFYKVVCVCLVVCFALCSPVAAFASTTESMMMFNTTDSMMKFSMQNNDYAVMPLDVVNSIDFSAYAGWYNMNDESIVENKVSRTGLTNGDVVATSSYYGPNKTTTYNKGLKPFIGFSLGTADKTSSMSIPNNSTLNIYLNDFYFKVDTNGTQYIARPDLVVPFKIYADMYFTGMQVNGNTHTATYHNQTVDISNFLVPAANPYEPGFPFDCNATIPVIADTSGSTADSLYNINLRYIKIYAVYDLSAFTEYGTLDPFYKEVNYGDSVTNVFLMRKVDNKPAQSTMLTVNYTPGSSDSNSAGFNNIQSSISSMNSSLSQKINNVGNQVSNSTNTIVNQINQTSTAITNKIDTMSQDIQTGLSNVVESAKQNTQNIINTVTQKVDQVKETVTEVKDSILDLPNKLQEMLTEFIVPDAETMGGKYSEFTELLEEKLGVIYQIPAMILELFETLVSGITDPQTTLTFPSLSLPWIDGTQMKLWDSIEFEIIPTGMDVLKDLIQTVTSMVCVIMTFNSVKRIYENFLRGR